MFKNHKNNNNNNNTHNGKKFWKSLIFWLCYKKYEFHNLYLPCLSVMVCYFAFVMFLAFVVEHQFSWLNRRLWGANIIYTSRADKNCWTLHDTTSVPPGSVIQVGCYCIDLCRARREKPTIFRGRIFRSPVVAIFDVSIENTRGCYTGLWKEKTKKQNNDCNTFLLLLLTRYCVRNRFHMFYTWCELEINNAKKEKTKQKNKNKTRHDCALCKGTSEVRRKHSLKWRNHFNSLVVLQTKTCSRKSDFATVWPLLTFDLYWGHDCPQFDSLVLLTMYESHMAWSTIWPLMIFGWPSRRSSSFLTCSGTSDQIDSHIT